MDEIRLLQSLSTEDSSVLLELLKAAFREMEYDQRQAVFGRYFEALPPAPVDGEVLLNRVEAFRSATLAGVYYAPFDINSKNWRHIPEETEEWFDRLGDLLKDSTQLAAQGDHLHAVACFGILYELIDAMESGEDIVFGDEVGMWMILADEKGFVAAYMASLAATATPEEFASAALPLIRRDTWQGFATQAYASAIRVATEAQKEHLEAEVERRNIRTGRES